MCVGRKRGSEKAAEPRTICWVCILTVNSEIQKAVNSGKKPTTAWTQEKTRYQVISKEILEKEEEGSQSLTF